MGQISTKSTLVSGLTAVSSMNGRKHNLEHYDLLQSMDFISKIFDLSSAVPISEINKKSPKLRIKNSSPHAIFTYGVFSQMMDSSTQIEEYEGKRLPVMTSPFMILPGEEAVYDFTPIAAKESIAVTMRFMITKDTLKKPSVEEQTPVVYFDIVFETGYLNNNLIHSPRYYFWLRYIYLSARTLSDTSYIEIVPGRKDSRQIEKINMETEDDFLFFECMCDDVGFRKFFPEFGLAFNNYRFDAQYSSNSFIEFV